MTVWLASTAFREICGEGTARHPLESGGILLGWRAGDNTVVIDVRGPGPQALHGRYRFLPDHRWQVVQIHRLFEETDGDIDYLGDWHSHPDGSSAMSCEDYATLRRISRRVHEPLMFIIADDASKEGWTIGCWKGRRHPGLIYRRFEVFIEPIKLFEPPPTWAISRLKASRKGRRLDGLSWKELRDTGRC